MWTSADLVLKSVMHVATQVSKMEEREASKACMFLFGMLLVMFAPVLAAAALVDLSLIVFVKIIIPLVSVLLMLCIGLPLFAIMRWLNNTYKFTCSLTAQLKLKPEQEHYKTILNHGSSRHAGSFKGDPRPSSRGDRKVSAWLLNQRMQSSHS